jgi:membrane protein
VTDRDTDDRSTRPDGNAQSEGNARSERETGPDGAARPGLTEQRPGPHKPTELSKGSWWAVLKRTVKQFQADNLTDWAAALTYYGILSIFPALVALVSSVGLLGHRATTTVVNTLKDFLPPAAQPVIEPAITKLQEQPRAASLAAIIGLVLALWSASGYIAGFIRAANAIYDVPEGRPFWKTLPLRLGLTVMVGTLLVISALAVVLTGKLAGVIGNLLHVGHTAVVVWDILKWPFLLGIIIVVFALLYYLAPNAKHSGFRWLTPGSVLGVLVWIIASLAFALYLSTFASYAKTYGTLGSAIAFLVWLWISNIAVLLGAEFDAEMERGRAIEGGMKPTDEEPYLPLRDDRKVEEPIESKGLG